jgi:hypothetical protein
VYFTTRYRGIIDQSKSQVDRARPPGVNDIDSGLILF